MDITALLSQNMTKSGPAGQPMASDGEAFTSTLQTALQASAGGGENGEAALALLQAGGQHITGEASEALRHALEALANSRPSTITGDVRAGADDRDASAIVDGALAELRADTDNPLVTGLAAMAPLNANNGTSNAARELPTVRVPETLNRAAAASGWPTDSAAGDTATPAPTSGGDAKPAAPVWAASAQALSAALDQSRLDARLSTHQDGAGQTQGVLGTGHSSVTPASGHPAGGIAGNSGAFTLQAPVASAPWQQQLGQQMVGLAQRGDQHMELHLNPRELGPLSVSLKLDDQGAQAHFFSSHSTVRGAVEQAIPQLREALAEQGIALGEAMVGEHRQGFTGNGDGQPGERGGAPSGDALADDAPAAVENSVPVSRVIGDAGGVDLYA